MALGKESLEIKITVDSGDATKQIKDVLGSLATGSKVVKEQSDKASSAIENIGKSAKNSKEDGSGFISSFKSGFDSLFIPVTALNQAFGILGTVVGQLGSIMEKTVGSAMQLGLSVAQINTLLTETERKTFDASQAILGLQAELGGSQQDIARGFYETLASGAVSVADSHKFMRDAMKLAVGGLTDVTTAQKILTAVTAAFGKEAGSTTHIADALFIAAAQGATDVKQLSNDLGGAIGTAKTLGVSFDELISFVSALTLQGISTSEAVTSVNSAMIALARQTPDLTSALKDLYTEDIRTVMQQRGLVNVLREVTKATGGSAEAVINLMGRTEALKAISGATSKEIGDKFNKMYGDIKNSLNNVGQASGNAFNLINETTAKQLDIFKARLDVLFTSTSKSMGDMLGSVLKGLNSVLAGLIKLVDGLAAVDLAGIFKAALPWIIAVGVALTPTAITGALQAWTAFGPAITAATIAMKGFVLVGLKVALITTAISTVVVALDFLIRNVNKFEEIFTVAIDTIILGVLNLKGALLNLIPGIDTSALTETANQIQEVEDEIGKTLSKADFDTGLGGALFDGIQSFMGAFSKANNDVQNSLTETAKIAEKVKPPKPPDEETMRRYNALKSEVDNWKSALDKVGQTEEQAAKAIAARQMQEIKGVRELLKAESRLTGERRKFLAEAEATVEKRLTAELKVIEEKRQKEARDASIEASKLVGDQTTAINLEYQKQLEAWRKLVEERKLSQEQFNKVSIQLEKDRQEAIKALEPKKQQGLGVAASIVEGVKGGAAGLTSTITELATASHKAQLEFDLANKKITQSAFDTSMKNIGWIGQIIKGIIDIFGKSEQEFQQFVQGLLQTANKLPIQIFKNIPVLIEELLANIPGAMQDALTGIVESTVGVTAGILKANIKMLPVLMKQLFSKEFWNEIVFGFFRAMRDGIYEIGDLLAEAFSGKFDFGNEFKKALDPSALVKSLSGVSDELFSVLDVTAGQRGKNVATEISDAISRSTRQGVSWLSKAWEAFKQAAQWVYNNTMKPFVDSFLAGWNFVYTNIIQPTIDGIKIVWQFVYDTLLSPFIQSLSTVWTFIKETVWDPIISSFYAIGDFFATVFDDPIAAFQQLTDDIDRVFSDITMSTLQMFTDLFTQIATYGQRFWQAVVTAAQASWDWITGGAKRLFDTFKALFEAETWNNFGDKIKQWFGPMFDANTYEELGKKIWSGFVASKDTIGEWGGKIWSAFIASTGNKFERLKELGANIWSGLRDSVGSQFSTWGAAIGDAIKKAIGSIVIPGSGGGGSGSLLNKILPFSTGGFVPPLYAQTGLFVPRGTDTVPAMLTPGEFVLNRNAVEGIGVPLLDRLNKGGSIGDTNVNVTLHIKTEQPIDESFVRSKIMPTIKDEFRRASLDGRRILAPSGVR